MKYQSSEERRNMMLGMEPKALILAMALPNIVAMLIDAFYNLADTFFVSSIGVNATAAVAVNDSFMNLFMAIGNGFAFGLASYTSRLLGAKEDDRASSVASATISIGLGVALVSILFLWPFRAGIADLFGSTKEALKYSVDYATYIILAFPFTMMNSILNQLLKSEGNTTYAMVGMVSGCVLNCILDPIFINVLGWEVAGAAGATALSKVFSFIVLIRPYLLGKTIIKLSPKRIVYNKKDLSEVLKNGIPAFLRMGLMTFGSVLTNRIARLFGTAVLAGISIANKLYRFISAAVMGFGQGFGPCAGYCWGAKEYQRTKTLYYTTCRIGASVGLVFSVLMFIFAGPMISVFNRSADPMVMEIGMFKLRALCIGLIPHILTMVTNNLYQSLGRPVGSTIVGLSRQMIFLIPMVILLPKLFGSYGIAAAQGVADCLSGLFIALPFAVYMVRQIDKTDKEKNGQKV